MKHQSTSNHQVYTTSGIRFRPLIAASLAVALGVSVASAENAEITSKTSAFIEENVNISKSEELLAVPNSQEKSGIVVNLDGEANALEMQGHSLIFDGTNLSEKVNGIFVKDESKNDFWVSSKNHTLIAFQNFSDGSKLRVIRNNASQSLTFHNVSVLVGEDHLNGVRYGIQNNLSGVNYDFGSTGTFFDLISGDSSQTSVEKRAAVGVLITNKTKFSGNLTFRGVMGRSVDANNSEPSGDGTGGSAYGLIMSDAELDLGEGKIAFSAIAGGNGNGSGKKGNAYAIFNNGTSTIKNGAIAITTIGGGDTADKYILQNQGSILTFTNVSIIVGDDAGKADSTLYGIYHNLEGAKYSFGDGEGTKYTLIETDGTDAAPSASAKLGQSVIGAEIKQDAEFIGKLTLNMKGGAGGNGVETGKNGANGGNATGISVSGGTLLFAKDSELSLTVDGGANGAKNSNGQDGTSGSALGLKVSNGAILNASEAKILTLQVGNTKASSATALELENGTFAGSFTVDSTNAIGNVNATSATLIKSSGTSAIQSGIITLEATGLVAADSNGTKTILDNSGVLIFGKGTKINLGSLTSQTAHINVANGQTANLSLGANSVTNFTDQAFALEAQKSDNMGSINLTLGDQARLNFNAKAGNEAITKVTLAQDTQKPNTGVIFNLAGESGKIGRTPSAEREAKTLTISDLDTSAGNQFILYVDAKEGQTGKTKTYSTDKVVVGTTSTGTLKENIAQSQAQKLSIVFDEDKKSDILSITRENNVLVATSSDSKVKFDTTSYAAMGFNYASVKFSEEKEAAQTPDGGEAGEEYVGQAATPTHYYIQEVRNQGVMHSDIEAVASAFMFNYDLYLANFNSLNKRMGELRDNANAHGVWARVFNGQISNDLGLGTKSNYTTIQAGYDYAFGMDGANNYLGLAVSYGLSSSKMSSKARDFMGQERSLDGISTNAVEVAVYNSYVSDSGWYNDTIAKFSYLMSDFTIQNANTGRNEKLNLNNIGLTISDEVGYRFKLGEAQEWYIDPQVEIGFGYFNKTDLQRVAGSSFMNVDADSVMMLRARAGAAFAYDFKQFIQAKDVAASLYAGLFYEYDYINSGSLAIQTDVDSASASSALKSDGRIAINVGTNIQATKNVRIYADFEKSFEGKINTDYQINAGVRYSFGENVDYKPAKAQESKKAPLKLENETSSEEETTQEEN